MEKKSRRRTPTVRRAGSAAVLLCVAALVGVGVGLIPGASAAKTTFRPGLYVGATSQGEAVRLKVVGCGSKQCLETAGEAYFSVDLSCPASGQTEEQIVDLSQSTIPGSGVVGAVVGSSPGATEGRASEQFKVARNGTLTGRIHLSETLETGTKCDSGAVTLKAKIGGSPR